MDCINIIFFNFLLKIELFLYCICLFVIMDLIFSLEGYSGIQDLICNYSDIKNVFSFCSTNKYLRNKLYNNLEIKLTFDEYKKILWHAGKINSNNLIIFIKKYISYNILFESHIDSCKIFSSRNWDCFNLNTLIAYNHNLDMVENLFEMYELKCLYYQNHTAYLMFFVLYVKLCLKNTKEEIISKLCRNYFKHYVSSKYFNQSKDVVKMYNELFFRCDNFDRMVEIMTKFNELNGWKTMEIYEFDVKYWLAHTYNADDYYCYIWQEKMAKNKNIVQNKNGDMIKYCSYLIDHSCSQIDCSNFIKEICYDVFIDLIDKFTVDNFMINKAYGFSEFITSILNSFVMNKQNKGFYYFEKYVSTKNNEYYHNILITSVSKNNTEILNYVAQHIDEIKIDNGLYAALEYGSCELDYGADADTWRIILSKPIIVDRNDLLKLIFDVMRKNNHEILKTLMENEQINKIIYPYKINIVD